MTMNISTEERRRLNKGSASFVRAKFTESQAEVSLLERPAAILLIAVWFALGGGLVEALMAAGGRFVLHHYTHLNPHIAWMTPVGNAIILAIPGLIFFVVLWLWPSKTA